MPRPSPCASKTPHQDEDEDDDQDDAQHSAGPISPAPTVGPGRYGPEQQEKQNDQEDDTHDAVSLSESRGEPPSKTSIAIMQAGVELRPIVVFAGVEASERLKRNRQRGGGSGCVPAARGYDDRCLSAQGLVPRSRHRALRVRTLRGFATMALSFSTPASVSARLRGVSLTSWRKVASKGDGSSRR